MGKRPNLFLNIEKQLTWQSEPRPFIRCESNHKEGGLDNRKGITMDVAKNRSECGCGHFKLGVLVEIAGRNRAEKRKKIRGGVICN